MRYFEDFQVGQVHELGSHTVTREEMLAFARQYDPQPFHLDEEAGRRSIYGSIIASGWHTVCVVMRELVLGYLAGSASLASPGVDELRWQKPVRPGDALHVRVTVVEARRSRSKPDRGLVRTSIEAINQRGEIVMSMTAMNLIRCRDAAVR